MADHVSPETRSRIMRAVRSKDTGPELAVRRMVHRMGFRYRIHPKYLPGKPDLVFPARGKIVFVHGCFWHRHSRCRRATCPKTNVAYWQEKFRANVARDKSTANSLRKLGWKVMTVWECQLKNPTRLAERLHDFLAD